ncbi:dicarboxylate/amino acid:cation symporter [Pontibacter fetidus]|uniref:Cation:dicarboxylase symporter family transporter n=1 Tax=Pontibacter fetidus TaxID=2700082 RepID=A0A6B2GX49_9BACT|nr:cation:dicarboxylase symporter family transporter [Pontibacter fetidus]NDK54553.1 cation:dicarboxylase symporter family transporter [Pontibacter fetidus]
MKKSSIIPLATLLSITIAALLTVLQHYNFINLPADVMMAVRWACIGVLLGYGIQKRSLTTWILVSMVVGAEIGYDFPDFAVNLSVLSKVFLKLIKTIIAPLIFGTLVVGIAGHSNLKQVGSMGWKAIVYFEIVTTLALFIGLAAINITRAGEGISMNLAEVNNEIKPVEKQTASDIILHVFPENIAKSVAEGQVLQIVIFSVLFAIGLAMVSEKKRKPMLEFCDSLSEVMFKFTNIIMYFAPIGVGAAIAYTVGHMGLGILVNLFQLLATLYVALLAFVLIVLLPVALIARVPVVRFLKAISGPVSIAFATTSSEAALPRAMEEMVKLGVPRKIVAFVMPTGYSFNLDGTTLYLALASVFVAQAAGIELSWEQQLVMVFTLMLTSKGVAGVPRASLVILLGTVASFDLPVWPVFAILGIDELMDMARTSINVTGNCLATAVVARWEGELDIQPETGVVETTNPELPVAEAEPKELV